MISERGGNMIFNVIYNRQTPVHKYALLAKEKSRYEMEAERQKVENRDLAQKMREKVTMNLLKQYTIILKREANEIFYQLMCSKQQVEFFFSPPRNLLFCTANMKIRCKEEARTANCQYNAWKCFPLRAEFLYRYLCRNQSKSCPGANQYRYSGE